FFLLSGEHETLPSSEIKAILEAEGYVFRILEKLDQLLRIEADRKCVNAVKERAAYTKLCGLELILCEAKHEEILKHVRSIDFSPLLPHGENFVVRVKRVKSHAQEINSVALERQIGAAILQATEKTRVDLKNPDKTFVGILTNSKFIFGLKLADVPSKPFSERTLKNRPFVHPSAMQPKLARAMVNLARSKAGKLVFDPFCGTGSILIEAALIGCRVLGMDIKKQMAKGASRNFIYYGINPEGIVVGDAKYPPVNAVDCVVTDPPYGRSATTMRRAPEQVVRDSLEAIYQILKRDSHICMAAPETVNISHIGKALGYEHVESHFVYVHGSLTREVAVFIRK
ncbi:N-6 DNA methylase, partial [Candidatus Bathyarchaeota archaeon]|nr:N-6 DNA methylase [Candidatus Bathyarchaeota archaeon]